MSISIKIYFLHSLILFTVGAQSHANISLEDIENKLQSFEGKLANLTSELEKERNIRVDLEKSLDDLKMRNESACTSQCQSSDQSYLLLLLGDLQQQLQLIKDSKESTRKNESEKDLLLIKKQLHQLTASLFDLSYAVSGIKHNSLTNDSLNLTQKQIQDIQVKLSAANANSELLKVFQLQQQNQLQEHSADLNLLKRGIEQFKIRTTMNTGDLFEIKQNISMTQQTLELKLNETMAAIQNISQTNEKDMELMNTSLVDMDIRLQLLLNYTSESIKEVENNKTSIKVDNMDVEDKMMFTVTIPSKRNLVNFNSQTMPFEHVITNHGNGYNPGTSVFTAPANGYFVFFWEIQVPPDKICDTGIKKNGDHVLGLGTDARGNTGSQSASKLVILDLERGDSVWIETGRCDAIYDGIYSTFSGWRIA